MTPEIRAFLQEPTPLFVQKANVKSRIHRRVYLDYVGVKILNARGELEGELRVIGLFTSSAYNNAARTVPYLRHKVARVVERAGFDPASHSGKALLNVLENYPRDELFQVDIETLYKLLHGCAGADRTSPPARSRPCGSFRSLRLCHGLCAEGPLRYERAPAHRRVSREGL